MARARSRETLGSAGQVRAQHVGDLLENVAAASCFARLADERIETRHDRDRGVEIGIYSGLVSAHRPQVARLLEDRDEVSELGGEGLPLGRQCDMRQAREGSRDVDSGIAALRRDGAIEGDMPIENAAHRIGDRIIVVVAIDENRKYAGDVARSLRAWTTSLEQSWQFGENARRKAARHGRFALGDRDLTRRLCKSGDGVHDKKYGMSLIAKVFGDRHSRVCGGTAQQSALIARGDNGHRTSLTGPKGGFDEFSDFAPALSDQADDDHIESVGGGEHSEESRLSDARSREYAESLPDAERREQIYNSYARIDPLRNEPPPQGWWRRRIYILRARPSWKRAAPIDRMAKRVDDSAAPCR